MKKALLLFASLATILLSCNNKSDQNEAMNGSTENKRPAYAIVIHGGAGTITRESMTPEREQAYKAALNAALDAGEQVLKNGGSSVDAVEQTIITMENSPLFNAAKGAVFTYDGNNELDAAIMNGENLMAGAVAAVTNLKNPIRAARAVMEHSQHVMLVGKGAEQFAMEHGLDTVDQRYYFTQERWDALQRAKADERSRTSAVFKNPDEKFGTVGCVALDQNGNLAAGTSTGGMTNKRWNRIGDSPIIGAGTYANNATCGISCTGHGEYFIRYVVAHDVSALMEYKGMSLITAADTVINQKLKNAGGEGGLIAIDKNGNIAMPFNSEGMYRGFARPGERVVSIYKD